MATTEARTGWATAALLAAVFATVLNGIVVGYGVLWFQIASSPDSGDYAVSAGGYGAAALVLALAVPALLVRRGSRWPAAFACVAAIVFALLAAGSYYEVLTRPAESSSFGSVWDGMGGVLWAPWTWALIALGLRGVLARPTQNRP